MVVEPLPNGFYGVFRDDGACVKDDCLSLADGRRWIEEREALTVDGLAAAMRAMEAAPPDPGPLKYFATPAEMSNAAWRARFARNFPDVELVEVRPIPLSGGT